MCLLQQSRGVALPLTVSANGPTLQRLSTGTPCSASAQAVVDAVRQQELGQLLLVILTP